MRFQNAPGRLPVEEGVQRRDALFVGDAHRQRRRVDAKQAHAVGDVTLSSVPSLEPMSTAKDPAPSFRRSTRVRAKPCRWRVAVWVVPLTKGKSL